MRRKSSHSMSGRSLLVPEVHLVGLPQTRSLSLLQRLQNCLLLLFTNSQIIYVEVFKMLT